MIKFRLTYDSKAVSYINIIKGEVFYVRYEVEN